MGLLTSAASAMTWKVKVTLYVAIAVAIFFAGRQWLNNHDNKVAQETREEVTEAERVKAEASIKVEREMVAKELVSKQAQIDQLNADLSKTYRSLDNALRVARKAQEQNVVTVMSIPNDRINAAVRSELRRGQQPSDPGGASPSPPPAP